MNQSPVISVRNVDKTFRDTHAVNDLSLDIYPGQYVGLLGPNGAGKTTLVEMIEGIQFPDSGEITILGKTWQKHETHLRYEIGLALQETHFLDKLTCSETLLLFGSFYKIGKNRVDEILEITNLREKKDSYVGNLSGGQRQRLALGVAIINNPKIVLLDEPSTGLDPHARREIWKILRKLKEHGTTLILTTHYMEEAEVLCDRIVIMYKGKILADGPLRKLLSEHVGHEIIEFTLQGKKNPAGILKLPGVTDFRWNEDSHTGVISLKSAANALPGLMKILRDQKVISLHSRRMTLDDLFIRMTGRHLDE